MLSTQGESHACHHGHSPGSLHVRDGRGGGGGGSGIPNNT